MFNRVIRSFAIMMIIVCNSFGYNVEMAKLNEVKTMDIARHAVISMNGKNYMIFYFNDDFGYDGGSTHNLSQLGNHLCAYFEIDGSPKSDYMYSMILEAAGFAKYGNDGISIAVTVETSTRINHNGLYYYKVENMYVLNHEK